MKLLSLQTCQMTLAQPIYCGSTRLLVTNFNQPVPQVTQHTFPQQSKFTNNNNCYHFIYEHKIF